jgi:hypothetical protein
MRLMSMEAAGAVRVAICGTRVARIRVSTPTFVACRQYAASPLIRVKSKAVHRLVAGNEESSAMGMPQQLTEANSSTAAADFLETHGIDVEKLRNHRSHVLRYDVSRLEDVIHLLNVHKIDVRKVVLRVPRVLESKADNVADNLHFLKALPMYSTKMVESAPQLLCLPIPIIEAKFDVYRSLGIRPEIALSRSRAALGTSETTIRQRFSFLVDSGLDATRIVTRYPQIFGLTEKYIRAHLTFLTGMGLDTAKIINTQPTVFGCDPARKLLPIIEFITKDMGRSLDEINRNPACLSYSLKKRIKPRHRYMMDHGRHRNFSLSTLLTPTDENFARFVAQQPELHYRHWIDNVFVASS